MGKLVIRVFWKHENAGAGPAALTNYKGKHMLKEEELDPLPKETIKITLKWADGEEREYSVHCPTREFTFTACHPSLGEKMIFKNK